MSGFFSSRELEGAPNASSLLGGIAEQRAHLFVASRTLQRKTQAQGLFDRTRGKALLSALAGTIFQSPRLNSHTKTKVGIGDSTLSARGEIRLSLLLPGTAFATQFDQKFRPRKRNQRVAWVRAYLGFSAEDHEQVTVRRMKTGEAGASGVSMDGEVWEVVHGHMTVSVALALGLESLRVELVGEIPPPVPSAAVEGGPALHTDANESEAARNELCEGDEVCA